MAIREKIIINIDEEGKIEANTEGFKGEVCLDALNEILEGMGEIDNIKKTSDYFKKINIENTAKIKVGR
ncbi:DUF2997 domain-containing protein [Fusobacterium sp. MFO224]|uniref:DUF2997 domain-containing protein n=1 Tax=Fusobacterium sp. MFO224 TaxID=3378070 RepID=UPI0038522149